MQVQCISLSPSPFSKPNIKHKSLAMLIGLQRPEQQFNQLLQGAYRDLWTLSGIQRPGTFCISHKRIIISIGNDLQESTKQYISGVRVFLSQLPKNAVNRYSNSFNTSDYSEVERNIIVLFNLKCEKVEYTALECFNILKATPYIQETIQLITMFFFFT